MRNPILRTSYQPPSYLERLKRRLYLWAGYYR